MVGRVVRVAQVVVDFISGELLLAEAALHREPATEDHLTFPVLGELYYIQMVNLTKVLHSSMKKITHKKTFSRKVLKV